MREDNRWDGWITPWGQARTITGREIIDYRFDRFVVGVNSNFVEASPLI